MRNWGELRQSYAEATAWFLGAAELVGDRWAAPALGEWDVRALVGHTSRALLTVEAGLANPPQQVLVGSAVAYYQATRTLTSGAAVAQRGRDAGAALGAEPAEAAAAVAARVLPLLDSLEGTEPVTTAAGGMLLVDYLPTRVFELTVHTIDLRVALGVPEEPPPGPAALTLALAGAIAVADGRASGLLLALTGRVGLPQGFSVL